MISSPSPTLHCSGHCSPSFRSHCKCYYTSPLLQSSVSTARHQRHSPSIIPAPPFPRISAAEPAWLSGKALGASGEDDDAEPQKQIVDTSTQYSLPRTSADSLAAAQMPGTQTKTVCSALTLPWALYSVLAICSLTVHWFLITSATVASKGLSDRALDKRNICSGRRCGFERAGASRLRIFVEAGLEGLCRGR